MAVNRAARRTGLAAGMMLAGARALVPDLVALPHDATAASRALKDLARWAGRWTPSVSMMDGVEPGSAALMLDITGCAHLFGGTEAMVADILLRLRTLGLTARAATGPTPGAAFALATTAAGDGPGLVMLERPRLDAMVTRLPVEALRIEAATAAGLRAVGLGTIGAVARIEPAALARRFGAGLVRQLARARGLEGEALEPVDELVERRVRVRLAEPLVTGAGLEIALGRGIAEACTLLEQRCEGARRMEAVFWRLDGTLWRIGAGTGGAHRDSAAWTRLLAERLARSGDDDGNPPDPGFGVDVVEVLVPAAERLEPVAVDLDPVAAAAARSSAAMHRLADRLSARIGAGRVCRIRLQDRWDPQAAQELVPALEGAAAARAVPPRGDGPARARPPLLMDSPEPVEALAEVPDGPPRLVRWRSLALRIARADGPERLDGRLAGRRDGLRDYYRVETTEGRRLWLFRRGLADDPDGTPPQWFVHGLG